MKNEERDVVSYDTGLIMAVDTLVMIAIPLSILLTAISGLSWIRSIAKFVWNFLHSIV